jgi:hypothetical protein
LLAHLVEQASPEGAVHGRRLVAAVTRALLHVCSGQPLAHHALQQAAQEVVRVLLVPVAEVAAQQLNVRRQRARHQRLLAPRRVAVLHLHAHEALDVAQHAELGGRRAARGAVRALRLRQQRNKERRQGREALQHGVHEARVAEVDEAARRPVAAGWPHGNCLGSNISCGATLSP